MGVGGISVGEGVSVGVADGSRVKVALRVGSAIGDDSDAHEARMMTVINPIAKNRIF